MRTLEDLLADKSTKIIIVSGEGENGILEVFTGRRTKLAIRRRLERERCQGDRWAYVTIHGIRFDYI